MNDPLTDTLPAHVQTGEGGVTLISIRLDDDVRDELEARAPARGVGLATMLRELATAAARDARRARIRQTSA